MANLLIYGDDFSNSNWVKITGIAVTPNVLMDPNSHRLADKISKSVSNSGEIKQVLPAGTLLANTTYTFSVYQWVLPSGTPSGGFSFNVVAKDGVGTFTSGYFSGYAGSTAAWTRRTYTFTTGSSVSTTQSIAINQSSAVGSYGYLWGAQLVQGSSPETYAYYHYAEQMNFNPNYLDDSSVPYNVSFDKEQIKGQGNFTPPFSLQYDARDYNLIGYGDQIDVNQWTINPTSITFIPNSHKNSVDISLLLLTGNNSTVADTVDNTVYTGGEGYVYRKLYLKKSTVYTVSFFYKRNTEWSSCSVIGRGYNSTSGELKGSYSACYDVWNRYVWTFTTPANLNEAVLSEMGFRITGGRKAVIYGYQLVLGDSPIPFKGVLAATTTISFNDSVNNSYFINSQEILYDISFDKEQTKGQGNFTTPFTLTYDARDYNLIKNGDKLNASEWSVSTGTVITANVAVNDVSASYLLLTPNIKHTVDKITTDATTTGNVTQNIYLKPNTTYTLSFFHKKVPSGPSVSVAGQIYQSNTIGEVTSSYYASYDTWNRFIWTFTTGSIDVSRITYVRVKVTNSKSVLVYGVQLVEGSVPTPFKGSNLSESMYLTYFDTAQEIYYSSISRQISPGLFEDPFTQSLISHDYNIIKYGDKLEHGVWTPSSTLTITPEAYLNDIGSENLSVDTPVIKSADVLENTNPSSDSSIVQNIYLKPSTTYTLSYFYRRDTNWVSGSTTLALKQSLLDLQQHAYSTIDINTTYLPTYPEWRRVVNTITTPSNLDPNTITKASLLVTSSKKAIIYGIQIIEGDVALPYKGSNIVSYKFDYFINNNEFYYASYDKELIKGSHNFPSPFSGILTKHDYNLLLDSDNIQSNLYWRLSNVSVIQNRLQNPVDNKYNADKIVISPNCVGRVYQPLILYPNKTYTVSYYIKADPSNIYNVVAYFSLGNTTTYLMYSGTYLTPSKSIWARYTNTFVSPATVNPIRTTELRIELSNGNPGQSIVYLYGIQLVEDSSAADYIVKDTNTYVSMSYYLESNLSQILAFPQPSITGVQENLIGGYSKITSNMIRSGNTFDARDINKSDLPLLWNVETGNYYLINKKTDPNNKYNADTFIKNKDTYPPVVGNMITNINNELSNGGIYTASIYVKLVYDDPNVQVPSDSSINFILSPLAENLDNIIRNPMDLNVDWVIPNNSVITPNAFKTNLPNNLIFDSEKLQYWFNGSQYYLVVNSNPIIYSRLNKSFLINCERHSLSKYTQIKLHTDVSELNDLILKITSVPDVNNFYATVSSGSFNFTEFPEYALGGNYVVIENITSQVTADCLQNPYNSLTTADRINIANSRYGFLPRNVNLVSRLKYTFSVYLKSDFDVKVYFTVASKDDKLNPFYTSAYFNISSNWTKFSQSFVVPNDITQCELRLCYKNDNNSNVNFYVWGSQLVLGSNYFKEYGDAICINNGNGYEFIYQQVDLKPGSEYGLRFYYSMHINGENGTIRGALEYLDETSNTYLPTSDILASTYSTRSGVWEEYISSFIVPESLNQGNPDKLATCRVGIYVADQACISNIRVFDVGKITSPSLKTYPSWTRLIYTFVSNPSLSKVSGLQYFPWKPKEFMYQLVDQPIQLNIRDNISTSAKAHHIFYGAQLIEGESPIDYEYDGFPCMVFPFYTDSKSKIYSPSIKYLTNTITVKPGYITGNEPPVKKIGINFGGPPNYYHTEEVLLDIFKSSQAGRYALEGDVATKYTTAYPRYNTGWITIPFAKGGWNDSTPLDLDENGWIKSLPPGYMACALLNRNTNPFPNSPFPDFAPRPFVKSGKYILTFDGDGSVDFVNYANVLNPATDPIVELVRYPNRVEVNLDTTNGGGTLIRITRTNPNNYVRNIKFFRAEFESRINNGEIIDNKFLDLWRGFDTYRFMHWTKINGGGQLVWSDRSKVLDASYMNFGIPLEISIDICNKTHTNGWFNIPAYVNDDYVEQQALLLRDTMDPSLKIYLEYSNEFWNGSFSQNRYFSFIATDDNLLDLTAVNPYWIGQIHAYARRAAQVFNIFDRVFSGVHNLLHPVKLWSNSEKRLVTVINGNKGATGLTKDLWRFISRYSERPNKQYCDAIAPNTYFSNSVGLNGQVVNTMEEVFSYARPGFDYLLNAETIHNQLIRNVDTDDEGNSVKLLHVAYEGGPHFAASSNVGIQWPFYNAAKSSTMKSWLDELFNWWSQLDTDLLCYFESGGSWSRYGTFGSMETTLTTMDDILKHAKYKALIDAVGTKRIFEITLSNPQFVPNRLKYKYNNTWHDIAVAKAVKIKVDSQWVDITELEYKFNNSWKKIYLPILDHQIIG